MNQVLEINEELGYAIVEPGVSWFDLHDAIEAGGHDLVASIVDIGWGGVVSNTLEHGLTYMPYCIDQASHCGFEVVLPERRPHAHRLGRHGQQPDLAAVQARPRSDVHRAVHAVELRHRHEDGLLADAEARGLHAAVAALWDDAQMPAVVDALRELMLAGTIDMRPQLSNTLCMASMLTARADWYDGRGPHAGGGHRQDRQGAGAGSLDDALRAVRRRGGGRPQLRQAQEALRVDPERGGRRGEARRRRLGDAAQPARAGADRRPEPGPVQDGRLVGRRGGRPRRLLARSSR